MAARPDASTAAARAAAVGPVAAFVEQADGGEHRERIVQAQDVEVVVEDAFGTVRRFSEGVAGVLSPVAVAVEVGDQQPVNEPEEGGLLGNDPSQLDRYTEAQRAVREDMLVVGADAATGLLRTGQLLRERVRDG